MIELKTKRLRLLCLELKDMEILKKSVWSFEDNLGLQHKNNSDEIDELANDFCGAYLYHKENYPNINLLWYRIWQFVNVEDNILCGGACFKGGPNDNGEVEIGYGVDDDYQCNGIATEAIGEIVKWALMQENIRYVTAETEKDNIASQRVLEKLGLEKYTENNENYYWRV